MDNSSTPRPPYASEIDDNRTLDHVNSATATLCGDFGTPEPRGARGEWNLYRPAPSDPGHMP